MTTSSLAYKRLLSEQEINKVKDRFNQETENALEEAKRKQTPGDGQIPVWFYVILVYFAYDDIFRMMRNPLLLYPIVLVMSILGMLYSIGLGPVMIPIVQSTINMWLRQFKVPI